MGLVPQIVEALLREHRYRRIEGDVLLIGRQAVYVDAPAMLSMMEEQGVTRCDNNTEIEIDHFTTNRVELFGDTTRNISDRALFRLLGVPQIRVLDHSNYEGADLIHDLTNPIPAELRECADFILDGSTIDNVSDPGMTIRNLAAMLRPGGRLVTACSFSNHWEPYAILSPFWFLDFFVVNAFADCRVYICAGPFETEAEAVPGRCNVFIPDHAALRDPERTVRTFSMRRAMMDTIVIAEKGPMSTSHIMPVQQHYRSDEDWRQYRSNLARMSASQRPHLMRSQVPILDRVPDGYLYIARDFTARDPANELPIWRRWPSHLLRPRNWQHLLGHLLRPDSWRRLGRRLFG
jgi:hypothetical protein